MSERDEAGIAEALDRLVERIRAAEIRHAREPGSVALLAVSKTHPAQTVAAARRWGQTRFGENYLQEALGKIEALRGQGCEWHFIGALQSNKTRPVAEHFDWLHTLDRLKLAERLSRQRPEALAPLNVCIQVNVSGEASKSGVAPGEAGELARQVCTLPRLRLRGLMAIPALAVTEAQQRAPFARLRELLDDINQAGLDCDTLSMGMTDDLEAAIAEGSTMVRIGTAIFGPRAPREPLHK